MPAAPPYQHYRGQPNRSSLGSKINGNGSTISAEKFRFRWGTPYTTETLGTSYTLSEIIFYGKNGIRALAEKALVAYEEVNSDDQQEDTGEVVKIKNERKKVRRVTAAARYRNATQLENAALVFTTTHGFREDRIVDWDYETIRKSIAKLGYEGLMVVHRNGRRLSRGDLEHTLGIVNANGRNGKTTSSS